MIVNNKKDKNKVTFFKVLCKTRNIFSDAICVLWKNLKDTIETNNAMKIACKIWESIGEKNRYQVSKNWF